MLDAIISRIVRQIAAIRGVEAIVLGGSRARGWHGPDSDYDLGLYIGGDLDIAALAQICAQLDDEGRPDLASPRGAWGAWVDGGAWMVVDGVAVDIIYRDLGRIDGVIEELRRGEFSVAYHWGHPHGYVSCAYAGELAVSQPLHDPQGMIATRKAKLTPYPAALRASLIARFLGEARFTLLMAEKGIKAGDPAYTAGAAFRVAACLAQVIFAQNRQWLINEKRAVAQAAAMPLAPTDFARRIERVFAAPMAALPGLTALVEDCERLCR